MRSTASTIRVRSGAYLSPGIVLTPNPRRVAIPYPAPYTAGKGVLVIVGSASGVSVCPHGARHRE